MKQWHINQLSYSAIPINMYFNESHLAVWTWFFYRFNEKIYIITNWHNVSWRHLDTKQPLSNTWWIPNHITFPILQSKKPLQRKRYSVPLLDNEGDWNRFIHPEFLSNVDVVAIEIETNPDIWQIICINDTIFDEFAVEVWDELFILWFPQWIRWWWQLPIWKRWSIATEPDVDIDWLPKILIDTAWRNGMSGSPVIFKRDGLHIKNWKIDKDSIIWTIKWFVWIYSWRTHYKDLLEAQIWIVRKKNLIEEIILWNKKDTKDNLIPKILL